MSESLHSFSEKHIDEDCRNLRGIHDNGLFYNCTFCNLNDLCLRGCDLNASKFETAKVSDALGFTLTLGCHSFRNVEYSPLLFDLFLCLAYLSKGNDEKREKLLDVIGRDRAAVLLRALRSAE